MSNTEKINDAFKYIKNGEYEKAVELLQPFLQEGNATAQYLMGYMYNKGYGVSKDLKKAEELYLAAANQGLAVGYRYLGTLYYNDTNELQKAYQSFVKGARLHDKTCINNGKYMLQNQLGVTVTKEEETRWQLYEAYYDNDIPRMMTDIYYAEGKFSPEFGEELVDLYYYKTKHENDLRAMFTLACAYRHGKGTAQNTKKAIYWLKKLVEQNPNHDLAWHSLYELNEISQEELLEKSKYSKDKNYIRRIKEEFHLVEEEKVLSMDEEIKLISDSYRKSSVNTYLQVREFCRRHSNCSDLIMLKEAMLSIVPETRRSVKRLAAIDLYWVIDAIEKLGGKGTRGEKAALNHMFVISEMTNKWPDTEEVEVEYLYTENGKTKFMRKDTFELLSISNESVKLYEDYLKQGYAAKLHYSNQGYYIGITI